MKYSDVRFEDEVFDDHPSGWRSPSDMAQGFLLAWALEQAERTRINPSDPMAPHVRLSLTEKFLTDTLGELVRPEPASFRSSPATRVGRLTTLCIVWMLFDALDSNWRIRPGDFGQFGEALSFATGGTDRRSLFGHRSADVAKCLLAARISNRYSNSDELTTAEEWFVAGAPLSLAPAQSGQPCIPFVVGRTQTPIPFNRHVFDSSIWSTAQVLVSLINPEDCIERYAHRREAIDELLDKGAVLGAKRRNLSPFEAQGFGVWPGWPQARVQR
jgi:hypothetical protein